MKGADHTRTTHANPPPNRRTAKIPKEN